MRFLFLLVISLLVGCHSYAMPPESHLSDEIAVVEKLDKQLNQWHRTPYRYGGLDRNGVDCSGFVYLTFRDRFGIQVPRTTKQQTQLGSEISRNELMAGDLIFFKTGSGLNGLHVGIYASNNEFIHASSSKGVIRSSLNNAYWRSAYWQARRL